MVRRVYYSYELIFLTNFDLTELIFLGDLCLTGFNLTEMMFSTECDRAKAIFQSKTSDRTECSTILSSNCIIYH
jgi:hypothetical protein